MADEQYRWLDRETAERLLRGESLEAVDAADRDQAERLAKTLEALTVEPPLSSAELPGEAAALAAFRAARADRDGAAATAGPDAGPHATHVADVGLVRIGGPARAARRPRRGRPVRLALAATLAVGMVGGVAVAAGTGVLRAPFLGEEGGRPPASVSAPASPERPFLSPSPESGVRGGPTPDDATKAPADPGATDDAAPGGPATDRGSAPDDRAEPSGGRWQAAASHCRDLRDGKQLSNDRRRALENAAGGSEHVRKYCKNVLKTSGDGSWDKPGKDKSKDKDRDKGRGREKDDDEGDGAGAHRDGRGGWYGGGDRDDHHDDHRDSDRDGHRVDGTALAPSAVTGPLPGRVLAPIASR